MRTKYANNTDEELLALADMMLAISEGDLKELMAEMAQRLRTAMDKINSVDDREFL